MSADGGIGGVGGGSDGIIVFGAGDEQVGVAVPDEQVIADEIYFEVIDIAIEETEHIVLSVDGEAGLETCDGAVADG